MTFTGLDEVQLRMARLPNALFTRGLRKGVGPATTILSKATKANIEKGPTGSLKKAIGTRSKTYSKTLTVMGIIGARTNFNTVIKGKPVKPTKYFHLYERGAAPHQISQRRGKLLSRPISHPGARPRYAMRAALLQKGKEVQRVKRERILAWLEGEGMKR